MCIYKNICTVYNIHKYLHYNMLCQKKISDEDRGMILQVYCGCWRKPAGFLLLKGFTPFQPPKNTALHLKINSYEVLQDFATIQYHGLLIMISVIFVGITGIFMEYNWYAMEFWMAFSISPQPKKTDPAPPSPVTQC